MKPSRLLVLAVLIALTLHAPRSTMAQGALTPPGPPAPTFKTLEQIEPRTPITNLPYTISAPGSYYVATNLTCAACMNFLAGITITASGVTLDLQGFELAGVAGSQAGVLVSGNRTNLVIRNGTVRNWGNHGADCSSSANGQITGLRVSGNGSNGGFNGGIFAGTAYIISECTAIANSADGIKVSDGSTVINCTARANGGHGFSTDGSACAFSGCTSTANSGSGIRAGAFCHVVGNTCDGNGAGNSSRGGIEVGNEGNCIDNNTVTQNSTGIRISSIITGNIVIRNTARGNTINFDIGTGNTLGPTNNLVGTGGVITNQNPWANFSF